MSYMVHVLSPGRHQQLITTSRRQAKLNANLAVESMVPPLAPLPQTVFAAVLAYEGGFLAIQMGPRSAVVLRELPSE